MTEVPAVVGIACGVLCPELEALRERRRIDFPIRYLESNLHMAPEMLHQQMASLVESEGKEGHQVLLVYGDCHPHMAELVAMPGVVRVQGVNCCEILLGRERTRSLRKETAFCLLAEWTSRWREVLAKLLDLDEEATVAVMRECHSKLVYLDTGALPLPTDELKACSEYFGLPCEVLSVPLDHLLEVVMDAAKELKGRGTCL